jgi:glycosyltransferase involved in cell wall biosynthesis
MAETRTVLVVSNHGEIVGGGEVSLLTLLKGLDRSRWAPVAVVPSEGAVAAGARALGLPTRVIPLPGLRWPGPAVLRSVVALRRLARETGAVLLHANGSRAMFYAGLAGRLGGPPVIWHLRILEEDRKLDWLLVRLATRAIAISEAVRARLRRWPGACGRCAVVPNGIDLAAFAPARPPGSVRESLGLCPADRVIGTVGRLVPFKGHGYLLEAFAQLRQRHPGIRLLVVGDGPERDALERQARDLGIAGDVRFTGHREDVADLLAAIEVFVLPSLAEHFGRVLLEAMAMERPVVATDAGGVPEVVAENVSGLLVPPADPAALARAVSRLLTDSALARAMGRAGRRRVEAHYNLQRHAERVEAVYAEVLQERG